MRREGIEERTRMSLNVNGATIDGPSERPNDRQTDRQTCTQIDRQEKPNSIPVKKEGKGEARRKRKSARLFNDLSTYPPTNQAGNHPTFQLTDLTEQTLKQLVKRSMKHLVKSSLQFLVHHISSVRGEQYHVV